LARTLEGFREAPFTVQRLCELLLFPRDYYVEIDKLMHAVEKLLTVTSMVCFCPSSYTLNPTP